MARGNNHWDGDYGSADGGHLPASRNHQDHVYNGPHQHNHDPHNGSASLGECSAQELSAEADKYLDLLHPRHFKGGHQP